MRAGSARFQTCSGTPLSLSPSRTQTQREDHVRKQHFRYLQREGGKIQ